MEKYYVKIRKNNMCSLLISEPGQLSVETLTKLQGNSLLIQPSDNGTIFTMSDHTLNDGRILDELVQEIEASGFVRLTY